MYVCMCACVRCCYGMGGETLERADRVQLRLRSRHVILEWIVLGLSDGNTSQLGRICPGLIKDLDMAILLAIMLTTTTILSIPTMLGNPQLDIVVGSSDHLGSIRYGRKGGRAVGDGGGADVGALDLAGELVENPLEIWVGFREGVVLVDGLGFADSSGA